MTQLVALFVFAGLACSVLAFTSTVCEHQTMRLKCAARNEVLSIKSAVYGRKQGYTCRRKPIKTTNCAASTSLLRVRQRCEGRSACYIPATNGVFGDPCRGTFKYLRVRYWCVVKETACEGRTMSLSCPRGKEIYILSATYGRSDRTTCRHTQIRTTNCKAKSSLHVVQDRCHGRQSCSLPATNGVFGDPCVGTYKYLAVTHLCVPCLPVNRYQTSCEGHYLHLNCPSPLVLKVSYASYGRKNKMSCRRSPIKTTNCHARSSWSRVGRACSGKEVCSIQASNSVFGDPCRGTYKYLRVGYQCVFNG